MTAATVSTATEPGPQGVSRVPATLPAELLAASGIEKSFRRGVWPRRKRQPVLRGAALTLRHGEVVGLVGENGSGKTTFMKILVGALSADAGTVTRTGRLGYCPQEPLVYPRLSCDEHFDLFAHAYNMSDEEARTSQQGIYDALGFARYAHTRADHLSGGTLAKLNLGLALLADPDLLLLDEPYAGFDWDTYLKFWTLSRNAAPPGAPYSSSVTFSSTKTSSTASSTSRKGSRSRGDHHRVRPPVLHRLHPQRGQPATVTVFAMAAIGTTSGAVGGGPQLVALLSHLCPL